MKGLAILGRILIVAVVLAVVSLLFALHTEIQVLNKQVMALNGGISELRDQVSGLQALRQDLSQLTARLEQQGDQISGVVARLDQLGRTVSAIQKALEDHGLLASGPQLVYASYQTQPQFVSAVARPVFTIDPVSLIVKVLELGVRMILWLFSP